jgi:hypothetical protein
MTILSYFLRGTSLVLGVGTGVIISIPNIIAISMNNSTKIKYSGYIGLSASSIIIAGGISSIFLSNPSDIIFLYGIGGLLFVISYTRFF